MGFHSTLDAAREVSGCVTGPRSDSFGKRGMMYFVNNPATRVCAQTQLRSCLILSPFVMVSE